MKTGLAEGPSRAGWPSGSLRSRPELPSLLVVGIMVKYERRIPARTRLIRVPRESSLATRWAHWKGDEVESRTRAKVSFLGNVKMGRIRSLDIKIRPRRRG